MLLQEVVVDVAIKAHSQVSTERRIAAAMLKSDSSSSVFPVRRLQENGPMQNGAGPSTSNQTKPSGSPLASKADDGDVEMAKVKTETSDNGPTASSSPLSALGPEESVCSKCGKADCIGASGAVDCPNPNGGTDTVSATPTNAADTGGGPANSALKPDLYSHNPLYECVVCSRQVGVNRYAYHLAKCLGINNKTSGSRKPVNRSQKIANALEARKRATALVGGSAHAGSGSMRLGTPSAGGVSHLLGSAGRGGGGSRASTPALGMLAGDDASSREASTLLSPGESGRK
ncbi:hypothetical protein OC846_005629 [Tilletia horrida]|uniref:SAGA-associated factor 11 n=1 Tax=Tilletia horrida TaxID=155126 RepID=A0AAN6GKG3_9BASI|nr:hypothetical protein OC846_005629 [Tilletia horrida]